MKVYNLLPSWLQINSEETKTKKDKLLAYYEEAGPDYAAWSPNFNMHFGFYKPGICLFKRESMLNQMNQEILDRLQLDDTSGSVVDLGCGLGATLRYAEKQYPRLDLNGVTIVPWQVEQAKKLNKEASSTNIQIFQDDYRNTSFEDESVDAVYAIESSCYANGPGKSDLLKEMYRILKPGGRFVIADGFRKHSNPLNSFIGNAYRQLCESWALDELGNIEEVSNTLHDLGFKTLKVENISFRVAPSVAHVPFTVFNFLIRQFFTGKRKMTKERWDNLKSPLLTMIVGSAQKDFGYYLVSGKK